ncbi:scamp family-domain-containing protein, partial [Russula vinacea]
ITKDPFASTASLDVNPFDDPFPDQDSINKPSQYSHELAASRVANLDSRERDLERRERELQQKAETIRKHGRNNWPPFFPLVYHDISEEIPEASRPLITRLYLLWLILAELGCQHGCLHICSHLRRSDGVKDLIISIIIVPMISVLSFLLWYRPIYNGYMKEQSLYFYIYFFFCGWHLAFSLYMLLGIPSTGSAGIIQTIQRFSHRALGAGPWYHSHHWLGRSRTGKCLLLSSDLGTSQHCWSHNGKGQIRVSDTRSKGLLYARIVIVVVLFCFLL